MGDDKTKYLFDGFSTKYDLIQTRFHHHAEKFLLDSIPSDSKIVDVGCGTGEVTIRLHDSGYQIKGFDFSTKMIEKALMKNPDIFRVGDVEDKVPFKELFDCAISVDAWEFFPEPRKALLNINRALKERGTFVLIVPNIYLFPLMVLAEKIKLKKLKAFGFLNSKKILIEKLCAETGFELVKTTWIYYFIARVFILQKVHEV